MSSSQQVDIAIVGMQCVLPGARDLQQYWDNLVSGFDAITAIPADRMNGMPARRAATAHTHGGFLPSGLDFDPLAYDVMPKVVPGADPDQFLMLRVIDDALRDARVDADSPLRETTDIIIGRGGYMTNQMSEIYLHTDLLEHLRAYLGKRFPQLEEADFETLSRDLLAVSPPAGVDNVSTCIPNLVASRTANRLNLRGAAYTVDAACASSLLAVEQAVSRLRQQSCELAVAGGIHVLQTPSFWSIFSQLGAISPSNSVRPFDRRADGLLIGEGAGAVVLKRLPDAIAARDQIYAVIKGVGLASDGRAAALLTPASEGQLDALRHAYRQSGVDPDTISYLEAHGTGTTVGDRTELETIRTFFGAADGFPPRRALGSVKSMIGHTMPAAGIASLIKAALMLSNKRIVPSLHCEQPHEDLAGTRFYINRETRPWIHQQGVPRRAGVNAFGFGGINAHAILEEFVPGATAPAAARPYDPGPARSSELLVVSGETPDRLEARLGWIEERLQQSVALPLTALADEAASALEASHPCKLALVCRDREHLGKLLAEVRRRSLSEEQLAKVEDVYYSTSAHQPLGKIAGIFPGIGFPGLVGSYPDHLLELCSLFPFVRAEFDRIELRDMHLEDPIPTSLIFCPPSSWPESTRLKMRSRLGAMKVIEADELAEQEIEPSARNLAAACVTLSNWVSWLLLRELRVPFHMLCGQSQGELAAMCAADMLDINIVISRFWQALALSPAYAGKGRLASVVASAERIAPFLAEHEDTDIAIHVAPQLLIIGGTDEHLIGLCRRLSAEGMMAHMLPYPPIHTPRLTHMRDELMRVIDMDIRFHKPQIPVYSAITSEPFPDDEVEVRELALCNLDRSVRFWQTMHQLYEAGARIFVQVGGGSLSANIKSILPKPDIMGTAVDVDHREPLTQLHHLCARLLTAGIHLDLDVLYRYTRGRRSTSAGRGTRSARSMRLPLRMSWLPLPEVAVAAEEPGNTQAALSPLHENAEREPLHLEAVVPRGDAAPERNGAEQSEAVLPFVDTIVQHLPGVEIVTECNLDLDRHLHLHDHVLVDEGSGKQLEHRMPVLPLTMMLEALAESAAYLAPGLGLCGFERVSANRWIDFRDVRAVPLRVNARLDSVDVETGVHRIAAEIFADGGSRASAVVLFAETYQQDIELAFSEWTNPREWPLTAEQAYLERHMFHGPRFQCVTGFDLLSDEGLIGEITVQPADDLFAFSKQPQMLADAVALDGVLQLLGMWAVVNDEYVLPARINKLEFYRPAPVPGTRVSVRAEITSFSVESRNLTGNVEVVDADGQVWMRLQGVGEWLFHYARELQDTQRLPTQCHLATRYVADGIDQHVTTYLSRQALRHVNLEWLARLYLHQSEWLYFDALGVLRRQWEWLMGRIVAKDAARIYLAEVTGTEMLHPARVQIEADQRGKPHVVPLPGMPVPEVSLSHCDGYAMAIAGATACGIDIEPVSRDMGPLLDYYANNGETRLLESLAGGQPDDDWPLRFWCAKEATAKAAGTGFQGRPRDIAVLAADGVGRLSCRHIRSHAVFGVCTLRDDPLIIAMALPQTEEVWDQDEVSSYQD